MAPFFFLFSLSAYVFYLSPFSLSLVCLTFFPPPLALWITGAYLAPVALVEESEPDSGCDARCLNGRRQDAPQSRLLSASNEPKQFCLERRVTLCVPAIVRVTHFEKQSNIWLRHTYL